jgi:membrane protease YdiL (CAAX protease family)
VGSAAAARSADADPASSSGTAGAPDAPHALAATDVPEAGGAGEPGGAGEADETATPVTPRAPWLGRFWTVASALVLVPVVVFALWPAAPGVRVDALDDPERALARIVERTMDLRDAVARTGPVERRVYRVLGIETAGDLDQAIAWYDELDRASREPSVSLSLAVLEAEARDVPRLRARVEGWLARDDPYPTLAALVAAAYLDTPSARAAPGILAGAEDLLSPGWFRDRLLTALGRRLGAADVVRAADLESRARSSAILGRVRTVVAFVLVTFAGASAPLVIVVLRAWRRPSRLVIGTAPIPPPWRGRLGAAVLIRGGALAASLSLALWLVLPFAAPSPAWQAATEHVVELLLGLLLAVPAVVLAWRHLFRPCGIGAAEGLGLGLAPHAAGRLVLVVPAVIGLMLLGDSVVSLVADRVGAPGHWTEWFDEALVFGAPGAALATLTGAVVLAPLTEELVFRGLMFATLRRRAAWPVAAAVSALAFAALHGYGVAGFASVWWSGFVWAWTYERTRSVWPAIAAHAAGNLWASVLVLVLLR